MSKSKNLGQAALNQVAEATLRSQFEEADELSVEVDTSPSALSKGEVKSMTINVTGVSLTDDIETSEMHIEANSIQVNPFKAMFGNIVLKREIDAIAELSFSAEDITQATSTSEFRNRLQSEIRAAQPDVDIGIQAISINFETGSILVDIRLTTETQKRTISLNLSPHVSEQNQLRFRWNNRSKPDAIAMAMIKNLEALLDTQELRVSGVNLQLESATVEGERLMLHLRVEISDLPSD